MKRLYRNEDIQLRPATDADRPLLYQLLQERYETGLANIHGMAAASLPTYEQHSAYLDRRPYRRLEIVAVDDGTDVGMMYLTPDQVGGCFVLQAYSGRGVALAACYTFFNTCEYPVTAHFNPLNRAGWRAADRTGWTLVRREPTRLTYELRQPPTDPFARLDAQRGRDPRIK